MVLTEDYRMSDACEVVAIETDNGVVEINKSDYNAKTHTLAGQKKEPPKKAAKKSR